MTRPLSHDLIYEAILDDDAFDALPGVIAEATGARSALFQWRHAPGMGSAPATVMAYTPYFAPEQIEAYATSYYDQDPWLKAGLQPDRQNRMINLDGLVGDETFASSAFYNDFIRDFGDDTFRCMGAIYETPFGTGAVGIHRGRTQDAFESAQVDYMQGFCTDLRRMMTIRGELMMARTDRSAARSSFDSLELAIFQVDPEGKVLDGNVLADEFVRNHPALSLSRGYLRAGAHDGGSDSSALKKAIALATDRVAPEATLLTVGTDISALSLTVSPLLVPGTKPRALVLIKPPFGDRRDLDKALMQLFGLSQAEARISISLAEGLSPADIAERRQVSEGTVRIQLKTIMAKLGCRRQTQIATAVLSLPPLRVS